MASDRNVFGAILPLGITPPGVGEGKNTGVLGVEIIRSGVSVASGVSSENPSVAVAVSVVAEGAVFVGSSVSVSGGGSVVVGSGGSVVVG